jgi:hypothetical protein
LGDGFAEDADALVPVADAHAAARERVESATAMRPIRTINARIYDEGWFGSL